MTTNIIYIICRKKSFTVYKKTKMTKSSSYKLAQKLSIEYNVPLSGSWVGTTATFWQNEVRRIRRTHYEQVLNPFIRSHLTRVPNVFDFRFEYQTFEQLREMLLPHMIPNEQYNLTFNGEIIQALGGILTANSRLTKWYQFHLILSRVLLDPREYSLENDYLDCQLIKIIQENPPIENQRNNPIINCAIKAVLHHLQNIDTRINRDKIKNLTKLNEKYFKSGIGDEGLQELAEKSYYTLVIKDKIRKRWRTFKPSGNKRGKTLLLVSHNNHLEDEGSDTSDGEELEGINPPEETIQTISVKGDEMEPNKEKTKTVDHWCNTKEEVVECAKFYENQNGNEGMPIISKGDMVAYITPDTIYKTKFHEWEIYGEAFTSGGVGKAKFIEQHPEFIYGINKSDPFYQILMDSDQSGFYMRTEESKITNIKYDQNHSYKSFSKSGIFQGFPIIEAIFKVDKLYSEFSGEKNPIITNTEDGCDCGGKCEFCINDKLDWSHLDNKFNSDSILDEVHSNCMRQVKSDLKSSKRIVKHGLLYVEFPKLIVSNLDKPIYYECSGWYPIEVVRAYYEQGINPMIKSWAYASKTFDIDFSTFTNDQFRTFLGKCISKSYDEVWRTKDFMECERARYILQDQVRRITKQGEYYQIEYVSEKTPWNFPVVSSYVKHHQKFNLFKQYNKLIASGIVPVAINVDGIEIKTKSDNLFDIGKNEGQWKLEKVKLNKATQSMVIERIVPPLQQNFVEGIEFKPEYVLPRFLHLSGAGGNGKTEEIIKLNLIYKKICYMAPTHEAVKNLLDRAKTMNTKITANTYHKVFATSSESRDSFDRSKYTHFILDECSMLSDGILNQIISKLQPHQSLIMAGDFWQLPCVEGTQIYDNWTGISSETYKQFEIRELTKNWRQQHDSEFFELCQKLRNKLTIKEAILILEKLNTRVVPRNEQLPNNTTLDDIHICGINEQVNYENSKYDFQVGSKIMCNITCKDREGNKVPNGSIGIITHCWVDGEDDFIKVDWGDSQSTFKGTKGGVKGKSKFSLAYALTIHKSQGKTIKRNVIINPSRLFSKNHLYVALTRATIFNSIFLTQPMSMNTFMKTVNCI